MHLHLQIVLLSFTALICIISANSPGTMTFTLDAQFDGIQTPHEFKHVLIEQAQGEGSGGRLKCEPQIINRNPVKFSVDWKTCMQKVEKAADLNDVKIVVVFSTHQGNEQPIVVKFRNYRSNDLLDKLFAGGEAKIVIQNHADPVLKYKGTEAANKEAGSSFSSLMIPRHHRLLLEMEGTFTYRTPRTPFAPILVFSVFQNFDPYAFVGASIDFGEEASKCWAPTETDRYGRKMTINVAECGIRDADDLLKVKIHLKFCNGRDHMEKLADFAGKTAHELDEFMSGFEASIDFNHGGNGHGVPRVQHHNYENDLGLQLVNRDRE